MGSVSLSNIRKSYGAVEVLHGINLDVADGEFTVLVGPSGCGKSTLLRSLAGLETISSGEITIDGKVVNKLHPKHRDIAMVFQNYALYPHMNVAENMGFSLKLAKVPRAEIEAKVRKAAEILDLTEMLGRKPAQLSGGQRQRVAMGRAIVRNPAVFLFDEPLSNLDAKLRVQMRSEIKELHQRLGTTIVYVTHDQIEAMTMADRIVVMKAGHVEQIGAPLELYDNPANVFVAGFIGSPAMNFLHATAKGGQCVLADGTALGPLPVPVAEGRSFTLGIRPEHFIIDQAAAPALVSLVEPTGAEIQFTAHLGGASVLVTTRDRITARVGDPIGLRVEPGRMHAFDAKTGQRIEG
ncbi:sn-glycerol-3-phosphate ABC transporter ATP-binding protein UgpC [Pseudorhodobacter sp. E13]|uniref:ABC transporter ATP-binding protein n=1 Tax=Pseudorhodobacter sp. E13 TaxID=2487931 RepID=UPI000F8D0C14|nr:sn-glycerol-3-phosphate ABC transporter ATP-binding protein UgpC [Pseudorhodobacter sp. E13]RUS65030.1 sn-glycerol-3-phosphate ABC transporter ATP-binding protein UgpC [Pseudorhodobacter sp. E13]